MGPNGTTTPTLTVDSSVTSAATGLTIKAAAAGSGLAVSTVSSGTNESLTIDAKGSGTITLGTVSTGAIVHSRATTLSAALTYGGVTLANSVTGTGSMVLSTSPSLTTPTLGAATATTLNGNTFTTGTYTLTGTAGKTLTFNNSITLAGTDAQTYTFPSVSDTIPGLARAQTWTAANTYTSGSIKFTSTGGPFANGQQIGSGTALATCALGGAGTCSYTTTDGSFSEKITLASASVSTTTLTMTFPNAATNMYVCYGYDFTTPAQRFLQTGGSATTAVMTFYSLAGVAGYASGGASDVLYVACMGN